MTKRHNTQLELPVLAEVSGKRSVGVPANPATNSSPLSTASTGTFHKPASADDQLVYKAISDNYFRVNSKRS